MATFEKLTPNNKEVIDGYTDYSAELRVILRSIILLDKPYTRYYITSFTRGFVSAGSLHAALDTCGDLSEYNPLQVDNLFGWLEHTGLVEEQDGKWLITVKGIQFAHNPKLSYRFRPEHIN